MIDPLVRPDATSVVTSTNRHPNNMNEAGRLRRRMPCVAIVPFPMAVLVISWSESERQTRADCVASRYDGVDAVRSWHLAISGKTKFDERYNDDILVCHRGNSEKL